MNRSALVLASLAAVSLLPVVSASPTEPECMQVYPWSKLCEGDVEGFVCAVARCGIVDPEPEVCSALLQACIRDPTDCLRDCVHLPVYCLHGDDLCPPNWD